MELHDSSLSLTLFKWKTSFQTILVSNKQHPLAPLWCFLQCLRMVGLTYPVTDLGKVDYVKTYRKWIRKEYLGTDYQ